MSQGLAGLHDLQIVIRLDTEERQNLIEQLAVLAGDADLDGKPGRVGPEGADNGTDFDGLRPGAEDRGDGRQGIGSDGWLRYL